MNVDVCVVGAGYAGLSAARRLAQAGKSVVVLEARDRVGGRVWSVDLPSGTTIDRGAGWLGPGHAAMFDLAREFGVETYKTNVKGYHLLVGGGKKRRYTGLIPKISPRAVISIARAQSKVDRLARTLPMDAPWNAPKAKEWDQRTIEDWLKGAKIRTKIGYDLFETAVRGCFTCDLKDASFLHLLTLIRAAGSINTLFSIENGYQETLVEGGAGRMAKLMAEQLDVRLNSPVRAISQPRGGPLGGSVDVATDSDSFVAQHVVVSTPPALTLDIAFDPVLPDDRLELYRASVAGPETKTLIVYDEPFWRADGYSGQTAGPNTAAEVTLDSSPMNGSRGVIASFTFGPMAEHYDAMDASERKRLVLEQLTDRLGPRAATPIDFVETSWWNEGWTKGCSMAHLPPGILTKHGRLIREPFGRVHWAGTETATVSHGSMDGAARSGLRAADEILSD